MMMIYLCSFRYFLFIILIFLFYLYIVNHKRIYVTIVVLVSASTGTCECVGVPVPARLSQCGHKWLSPHLYIEHCVENKVLFNCYSQVCT